MLLLLLLFLTFSVLVANPKKLLYTVANPARGMLNRKERTKEKHLPPPLTHTHTHTHCSFGEKTKQNTRLIYRGYAGLGRSRVRTKIPSARRLGQWVWLRKTYASVCDSKFPSLVAYFFSWRYLAASTSSFLHATMNLRLPSVTVSSHTSAFNAVAFLSPAMPNARMRLCTQSVHYFSFLPRPLRTALSRFPNTIRFGSRPPLIRMSVPAHNGLLVRNVVSMLSYRVISRARLYEVIRWSGL